MKPMWTMAVGSSVRITSSNLRLPEIHQVDLHPARAAFPGGPIHAADLVVLEQAAGEQAALAARDAGDEHLFHGFPEGWSSRVTPTARAF
jgi:hypothetical protein